MSEITLKIDKGAYMHGCARSITFNIMFLMIDCSCKIDYKMKSIGNYTCSRTINEKSHLC
jgi:hypothetical protein